jgi:hypothetical protein
MYIQGRGISVGKPPKRFPAPIPPDVSADPATYYLIEVMKVLLEDKARYLALANSYIDEFVRDSRFELMAAGSLVEEKEKALLISHLWRIPDANQLWEVMNKLGKSDTYCDIDDLVSKTDFEIQDIAVGFGSRPVNERPPAKANSFRYVVADYHQWTNGLSGWDLEFDAGYEAFIEQNPEWTHLGNRMALTGSIYRLQQSWMIPTSDADSAQARLDASDWSQSGYRPKRVLVFEPTSYDWRKRKPKRSTTKGGKRK